MIDNIEITTSTQNHIAKVLQKAGYASPIRTPRGRDVMAACGQLKSTSKKLPNKITRINSSNSESNIYSS